MMLRSRRLRWFNLGSVSEKKFFVRFSFVGSDKIRVELCPYSLSELPKDCTKTNYVVFDDDSDALLFVNESPYLCRISFVGRYSILTLDYDGGLFSVYSLQNFLRY